MANSSHASGPAHVHGTSDDFLHANCDNPATKAAATEIKLGSVVNWNADHDGTPKLYKVKNLNICVANKPASGKSLPIPTISVSRSDSSAFLVEGIQGSETPHAWFMAITLDPEVTTPSVVFATYSYGAHCCTRIDILQNVAGRWKRIFAGNNWDGDPLVEEEFEDLDGDGGFEFIHKDDRFDYKFASYAGSAGPLRIWKLKDGLFRDVSAESRYKVIFEDDARSSEASCMEHQNGACARFVASSARAGNLKSAWAVMLANYDRDDGWTNDMSFTSRIRRQVTFHTFPAALKWFLAENGYVPERVSRKLPED